jgi:hypothetical protein
MTELHCFCNLSVTYVRDTRSAYKILEGKPEGKRSLGRQAQVGM